MVLSQVTGNQVQRAQNRLEIRAISRQHGGLIHKRVGQNQDDTAHGRTFSQAGVSGSDG